MCWRAAFRKQEIGFELRLSLSMQQLESILWAERYDRELKDIFALQDDITKKIITAMQVKLTEGEQVRAAAKGTNNLQAYLKCLQANEYFNQSNIESNALAKAIGRGSHCFRS